MNTNKTNPIYLYKQHSTQSDSRNLLTSSSRSRLRDNLQSQDNKKNHTANKINTIQKQLNIFTHSRTFTMTDQQQRIKRNYSPLYQRSVQQSQLFQKGVKKSQKNINLQSKIDLTFKQKNKSSQIQNNKTIQDISPRTIKRRDPNQQQQNILKLGAQPLLSNRKSINKKRDPNIESYTNEKCHQQQKSVKKRDPNKQSSETADYVVKALSTHTANKVKQVHLKFYKKENLLSKENQIEQINQNNNSKDIIINQHKRHFSHLNLRAIKNNIQFKQNGISLKQNDNLNQNQKNKHDNKLFNHDFYKKNYRIPNKENIQSNKEKGNYSGYGTIKTSRPDYGTIKTSRPDYRSKNQIKTQYQSGNQSKNMNNRMAQLRKKFL